MPVDTMKATRRLKAAEASFGRLVNLTGNFEAFEHEWFTFISAIYSAREILKKACTSPQDRQWFGAKEKVRRDDAAIQYIYQARHSDTHTLSLTVLLTDESDFRYEQGSSFVWDRRGITMVDPSGKEHAAISTREVIYLGTIRGRGGDGTTFKPPEDLRADPVGLAKYVLDHYSALIAEAAGRA
jgi:hypothetical protein